MGDCDRTIPNTDDHDIVRQAYPASSWEHGPLHPLDFPYSAACEAISVCIEVADMLHADLEARADLADDYLPDWKGRYREDFDYGLGGVMERLIGIESRLRTLAGDIGDNWDEVVELNGERETNRESYDAAVAPEDPQMGPL